MSATNRGTVRAPDDYYSTPPWCVEALLTLPGLRAYLARSYVIDPCAGDGAILASLTGVALTRGGVELSAERAALSGRVARTIVGDFLSAEVTTRIARPEWQTAIITNPPYSLAMEFVCASLTFPACSLVAMLLRVNWLAGRKRAAFHKRTPAAVRVLSRRPSFAGNGATDATEYAWFLWGPPDIAAPGTWGVLDTA